ncbi:glycosyltransferase family 2 protein [Pedobacter rhizosphaerae]|uniref:Glycosyl transferase family 2 n=1 Tax=Pedobacter rhizosphaerae TaxID=390241 RepID=A0A1H9U324_9SPHI|nr:glycosyltransferase family A protein [Pedobacter rhizosphaerae]SES03960.1 Glycosyl transferase family 2 [Pedobacter rhizosphaerae]
MNKIISVIIPAYNSSQTIVQALDSVFEQTLPALEVIVINDGSKDNTLQILQDYKLTKHRSNLIVINKENGGVSSARNCGMAIAKGEWIAFLDSDDCWHPEKLNIVSMFLDKNFSLVGHGYQTNSFTKENFVIPEFENIKTKRFGYTSILLRNRFVTPSVVVRNTDEVRFDESMKYAEDHDLWLRLSEKLPALYLELPLVKLSRPLLTEGGLSGSKRKMRAGEMKMFMKQAKTNNIIFISLPFLIAFSSIKFILKIFR